MTMICPKSCCLIVKHTTLEEKEPEGLEGAGLNPQSSSRPVEHLSRGMGQCAKNNP